MPFELPVQILFQLLFSFELETLQANPNKTALLYKDDDAIRKKFCLKIWSCCIVMRISTVGV